MSSTRSRRCCDRIGHRPYDYFKRMLQAYDSSDLLRVYIAEHEGEALSGAICIHYGQQDVVHLRRQLERASAT